MSWAGAGLVLALGLGLLVAPSFAALAPAVGSSVPGGGAGVEVSSPASSGGCAYPLPGSNVSGRLTVEGGPLEPQAAANVTLEIAYSVPYELFYPQNGTKSPGGCVRETASGTTAANGSFVVPLPVPSDSCSLSPDGWVCTSYSQPFGPAVVSVPSGPPAGYALSDRAGLLGLRQSLAFVWELAYVTIAPGNATLVTSANAPLELLATGWMANGSTTPLAPTFAWNLTGAGWAFGSSSGGAAVEVVGVTGAALGTLSVKASAQVGTTLLEPPPASVGLDAVTTEVTAAAIAPTLVDAGAPVSVTVQGTGAEGYAYGAWVAPGLGLAPVPAPCSDFDVPGGLVDLTCTASFAYPSAGLAQPIANLTNGFSSASWPLAPVTVAPPAVLDVAPSPPTGYVGIPLSLELRALNGTGVTPYARACLSPGDGPPLCLELPGPTWTFDPVYSAPGSYVTEAWAIDGVGVNRSIPVSITIVPPLAVGPIGLDAPNMTVGVPVELTSTVTGGALPARFWWNVTGSTTPWSTGIVGADGELSTELLPNASGVVDVTLTVVDALGSVAHTSELYEVAPAPAVRVVTLASAPSTDVVAGTTVPLSWEALDRSGAAVGTFSAQAELLLHGEGAPVRAWPNASTVGPLAPLGNGSFAVPSSAWSRGVLRITVVAASTGTIVIDLVGNELPDQPPPQSLAVVPDARDVRLFAPFVAQDAARSNATFWHVEDRFGNPAPGAHLSILSDFAGASSDVLVAAVALPDGQSGIWINYSAPGPAGGTVRVVDADGVTVLGPIHVPAVPNALPVPVVWALLASVPVGVATVGVLAIHRRRRGHGGAAEQDVEAELRRLAEGRATIVRILARGGPADLPGIEGVWEHGPAPEELADWLASLVADGTIGARVGADGRPRFCLARGPASPRVEVDVDLLEQALRRRDEDATSPV